MVQPPERWAINVPALKGRRNDSLRRPCRDANVFPNYIRWLHHRLISNIPPGCLMMSADLNNVTSKPTGTDGPLVLALDIGTSSVRGLLYNERGQMVALMQVRLARQLKTTADGGAELDAAEAIEQTVRVVDQVAAWADDARIETGGVACFWRSLVGLDPSGLPVTPVFGWADTRAAHQAERLKRQLDERAAHARTGCRFHPSYWPAKVLWLKAERPEMFRGVRRWVSLGELLSEHFFNELTASLSMASGTGMLDLHSC